MENLLLAMVKKTLDQHVLPKLKTTTTILANFDLWMSHGNVNTFVLIINFLNEVWVLMHVTMGLFEVHETSKQSMAIQLQSLPEKYGLLHQVIAFVKDKGNNLIVMATTLQSIVDCEPLKLFKVYEGTCFGHIVSKVCKYAIMTTNFLLG